MYNNDANTHKTAGNGAKPAEIVLTDETTIDATHHFRTEDNAYVCVFVGARENGIDYRIPREQVRYIDTTGDTFDVDAPRLIESEGEWSSVDNTDEWSDPVTDNEDDGDTFDADQIAGDVVCYFGELFKIARTACGHAELVPVDEFGERVIKHKHQDATDRLHVELSEVDDVPDGWSQ